MPWVLRFTNHQLVSMLVKIANTKITLTVYLPAFKSLSLSASLVGMVVSILSYNLCNNEYNSKDYFSATVLLIKQCVIFLTCKKAVQLLFLRLPKHGYLAKSAIIVSTHTQLQQTHAVMHFCDCIRLLGIMLQISLKISSLCSISFFLRCFFYHYSLLNY